MRITNSMMTNNFMTSLNANATLLSKYQMQLASNSKITKLSDDPLGVIKSMQARVKLYRLDQYQKNVADAQTWLKQTEDSVSELNEVVKSAYENAVQMATDTTSASDKTTAAELIGQLRDHLLTIGNTKVNDKYIFGGYGNLNEPFEVDSSGKLLYNGLDLSDASDPDLAAEDKEVIQYEIGFGMKADVSVPGTKLFGTGADNLYSMLDGLYNALKNNATSTEIGAYAGKLQTAQTDVLSLQAEIGGRSSRLELMANRYEEDTINYTEIKSKIEDIDEAEVIMQYQMANSVYEAALKVGATIMQTSLMNFLD